MKKIVFALTVAVFVIACSSASFAYNEDVARDAMIIYSGTDAFADLYPEERQACMAWVSDGGAMSEKCRGAVTKLISQEPNVVTREQRRELLAAASGGRYSRTTAPSTSSTTIIKESDNTGALIAAGIVGIIAGMVIHNNLPSRRYDSDYDYYYREGYYSPRGRSYSYREDYYSPRGRSYSYREGYYSPRRRMPPPRHYRPAPHRRVEYHEVRRTPVHVRRTPVPVRRTPEIRRTPPVQHRTSPGPIRKVRALPMGR